MTSGCRVSSVSCWIVATALAALLCSCVVGCSTGSGTVPRDPSGVGTVGSYRSHGRVGHHARHRGHGSARRHAADPSAANNTGTALPPAASGVSKPSRAPAAPSVSSNHRGRGPEKHARHSHRRAVDHAGGRHAAYAGDHSPQSSGRTAHTVRSTTGKPSKKAASHSGTGRRRARGRGHHGG